MESYTQTPIIGSFRGMIGVKQVETVGILYMCSDLFGSKDPQILLELKEKVYHRKKKKKKEEGKEGKKVRETVCRKESPETADRFFSVKGRSRYVPGTEYRPSINSWQMNNFMREREKINGFMNFFPPLSNCYMEEGRLALWIKTCS